MNICDSVLNIEISKLHAYGASSARLSMPVGAADTAAYLLKLRRELKVIRRTDELLTKRYAGKTDIPTAYEWLLDNMYMVLREYRTAVNEISAAKHLRSCADGVMLSELCRALLLSDKGKLDTDRCREFLRGVQSVTVLRRSELNVFPAVLRTEIISSIADVCRDMQYANSNVNHSELLENLFGSLRFLASEDLSELLREADITDAIYCADPSGEYSRMDETTRADYLETTDRLARHSGVESHIFASRLIETAKRENRHIGFYLYNEKPSLAGVYIFIFSFFTLILTLYVSLRLNSILAAVLLPVPLSELVKAVMDFILLRIVMPKHIPRMASDEGVDMRGKTVCVISALLTKADDCAKFAAKLECLYHACRSEGAALSFGLLADLPGADSPETELDDEIISSAQQKINELNRKYDGRFYLFWRSRSYDGEQYTGHERKRGALIALARLICGKDSELKVCGDKDALNGTKYILTLDSDTEVYPGSVGELISAALHPLNAAVIDEKTACVKRGHAIFHPRMSIELESANATDFAIVFSGGGGCDPYGALCGELYMDCFHSGGFAGKGLIDARALLECTDNRFPDGQILSHDALEGAYLRGAFVGDVEFSDSFPGDVLSYFKRQHRWIRGDWQNASWIFKKELSAIDRFKLFDSLRRSLSAPMTAAAIIIGLLFPADATAIAAVAALLCILRDILFSAIDSLKHRSEKPKLQRAARILTGTGGAIVRSFFKLWLLPYEAMVSASAIFTALWRMLITGKKLLQWQTAAQSSAGSKSFAQHIKSFLPIVLLGLTLMISSPLVLGKAAGFMWLLSPAAAYALALAAYSQTTLSQPDREYLLQAAADTWKYFSEHCTEEDNYLPPDNYQQQPPNAAAHRTSPTNIGLAMVSAVAACDMGIIKQDEAVSYVNSIMNTLSKLPLCMGHLYNWYDTQSLKPLSPAFISTVDSGNLCASLICVANAMKEYGESILSEKVQQLADGMSFSPLYDRQKGLFYICFNTEEKCGAGGWYDLMASEARLTSYLAVARGDVPKKHWRRLSRAQLRCDAYRGLASWTGTMFEYLMPELFLPIYRASLLYESSRFCVYAQRHRVFAGKPWGISESGYFALDGAMNYRYKANGVSALALKRGQDADIVISPYSSFLALPVSPRQAVRNLQRIELFGGRGSFGFYEALDFTPSRCRSDNGEKVRSFMAHHAGMSIIAAANLLCDNSIIKRFMSDSRMQAYTLLLQERLPDNPVVIRRSDTTVPERAERLSGTLWSIEGECGDGQCCLLSNGIYSVRIKSSGECHSLYGEFDIFRTHTLLPAPKHYAFYEDHAEFYGHISGIKYKETLFVAGDGAAEVHELELYPANDGDLNFSFEISPILAREADVKAHKAFWELGITREFKNGILSFRRISRNNAKDLYLNISSDLDFKTDLNCDGKSILSVSPLLAGAKVYKQRFVFSVGFDNTVINVRSRASMLSAAASLTGMNTDDIDFALKLMPLICENRIIGAAASHELWRFGISGTLPIIACAGDAKERQSLVKAHIVLKSCGVNSDLVILSAESGEYSSPVRKELSSLLSRFSLEALLGSSIFIISSRDEAVIASRAVYFPGNETLSPLRLPAPYLGRERSRTSVPEHSFIGSEFFFSMRSLPPKPWSMVLTNKKLSCIVSEDGSGYMFYENAREMQLCPGGEKLYAERDGKLISLFAANDNCACAVRYSPGCAVWEKEIFSRRVRTTMFIPPDINARVIYIDGAEGLKLHWIMPLKLGGNEICVKTRIQDGILIAENSESYFKNISFSLASSANAKIKDGFYPPAASFEFNGEKAVVLVCGVEDNDKLIKLCKLNNAINSYHSARRMWSDICDSFRLSTGCDNLDAYMHPWCLYQTLASRLYARAGFYQAGGAYGFRDQLQDAENLLLLDSSLLRERILDCCRHQYIEGDVMHWWHPHPDGDRGLRSRCSDDLLWLVRSLCIYIDTTGDTDICFEKCDYISSPLLGDAEKDRFETAEVSYSAYIIDHTKSALECSIGRGFGEHGLPYIGSCDWNDGFDNINGESVWLGWFMTDCLERFAALLERLKLPYADRYSQIAAKLRQACERSWCGSWYARAYYPDGTAIAALDRIDSLPQSWAAFCGGDAEHVREALSSALMILCDRKNKIIKLFSPPFSPDERRPGYISAYGMGYRENGGQYTHAAIWLASALIKTGCVDEGWEILKMLLPESHDLRRYMAEPFVLAADVYSARSREGEAGWTWYTGSSGWYFRVITEDILGIRKRNGRLTLEPHLPRELTHCTVSFKSDGECYTANLSHDGAELKKA